MSRHHRPTRPPKVGVRGLLHRILGKATDPRSLKAWAGIRAEEMRLDALEARVLMASTPLITEFMASNSNGLKDEDGNTSDWIELHNPSSTALNLDGYYLTDQSGTPNRWRIPAVTLPAGGNLVIFASEKDRAVAGQELHTDFNLSADGGYLALVAPDGVTVVHQYAPYPEQLADLSYGIAVQAAETNLISGGAGVKWHVPTSGALGTSWTARDYPDGSWTNGVTGVGYDVDTANTTYQGFKAFMVDTATGNMSNIGVATTVLNGNTSGFTGVTQHTVRVPTVNFGTIGGVFGGDENHPNDPDGQARNDNAHARRTGIAMRLTTSLFIPEGTYTINVGSDDGFRLTMPEVTFFGRVNENFTGATNPSPADTLVYGAGRGHGNTFAAFTVPAGGMSTNLQLDYYEGSGGDDLELSIALGQQTAFSTTAFQLLRQGALGWQLSDSVPPVMYTSLIASNIVGSMKDISPSAYIRAPFGVIDPDAFEKLRLRMRYDDGFIAYVNGVEVARRNAPDGATWSSTATADRADTSAIVREEIVVDIPADLLVEGQNILAIHGLNDSATGLDFLVYPELVGVDVIATDNRYFTSVTPGSPNPASDLTGRAEDPSFSHDRGFYDQPFSLVLETDTLGAQIRYTLDGSAPTATTGFVYGGPLQISGTTTLRAASFKAGMLPSEVDTQTYIFLNDVIHQSPQGQTPPGWPASWTPNETNYGMDPDVVNNGAWGTSINGVYYFAAGDPATGLELWRSDGTAAGTFLLKDINPGALSSGPSYLTDFNGTLYFRAFTTANGWEIWKSDGTAAGTVMVRDLVGGTGTRYPYDFVVAGGRMFFAATSSQGTELWVTDGTSAGTILLKDINTTGTNGGNSSLPGPLKAVGSTVYFAADDGVNGRELWKSDGTALGTVLVKNINTTGTNGVNSSNPSSLAVLNGVLYFSANDGSSGTELWKSDGTALGTVRVADVAAGSTSSSPAQLAATPTHIYFVATTAQLGSELWRTDGTTASLVRDITPGSTGTTIGSLTTSGGLAYFTAATASGIELWRSDGTSLSTFEVMDINPGTGSSHPRALTDVNGTLYFAAGDGPSGSELWRTNGTGATRIRDLFAGPDSSNPMWFAPLGGDVMFIASNHTALMEVWKTDGTEFGTTQLKSLSQGNTFLRLDDLRAIPTFSLTMNQNDLFGPTGIYSNPGQQGKAWERPVSIELIYPDGTEGFQADAGARLRGGFSRSTANPKHALRFIFRPEYGDSKLDYPLFGPDAAQEFDGFDLRTFQNYSWSFQNDPRGVFIRDQFSRDAANDLGATGPHGDYYHLYINGQYWGLYNTEERPEAEFNASYFGGDASDYDVIKHNGGTITATDGNMLAWEQLWLGTMQVKQLAEQGLDTLPTYMRLMGLNPDGSRNPDYPVLVDIDNLIDYMLVIFYGGNLDSPLTAFGSNSRPNNFYAARNRNTDEGFRFFVHDAEHTLLNVNEDRTGPFNTIDPDPAGALSKSNAQYMFQNLEGSPEFRLRVADRIHRAFFNNGALTPAKNLERFMKRKTEIERAVVAESARWGDAKRPANLGLGLIEWQNEVHRLTVDDPNTGAANDSYFSLRSGVVFGQLRGDNLYPDPAIVQTPEYSHQGGSVPAGFLLAMNNPGPSGTIYYTLDGSDPRLVGGGVSPAALVYSGPVALDVSATVRARVRLADGTWSAMNQKQFILPFTRLKVSELMYNNPIPAGSGLVAGDLDYIELINSGSTPIPLHNVSFTQGITFTFGGTPAPVLAGGARTLVVANLAAFRGVYGDAPHVSGVYSGSLSDSGETVTLTDPIGTPVLSFDYSDEWYAHTDGGGYSLVVRNPALATGAILSDENGWRPNNVLGGGPGVVDPGITPNTVVINEVVANATGPLGDWIELRNTSPLPFDVSGWFLSDSSADLRKYRIPDGTVLPPNGMKIFNWLNHFGVAANAGVNTPFNLSAAGAEVYLSNHNGAGSVAGYRDHIDFGASDPDVAMGRFIKSDGSSDFTSMLLPTPAAANAAAALGPVVINEIMYNPNAGDREFIELRNLTGQEVSLAGWKLSGVDYVFGQATTIPAYGYALVVSGNISTFRSQYAVPGVVPIYGPYLGDLANNGEDLKLSKPVTSAIDTPFVLVDKLKYKDSAPWPVEADGSGPSLSRVHSSLYGNDAANWGASAAAKGTPGTPNFATTSPVVDAGGDGVISQGGTFSRTGSFADPDDDNFSATVDWGDGSATAPLALAGDKTFNLSRTYTNPGTYTVTVNVFDGTVTRSDVFRVAVLPGARTGSGNSDNWAIRLDAGGIMVHFFDNIPVGATPSYAVPLSALASLSYQGNGGADTLTVDMANGNPIPAGGITFDGGAGSDQLHVVGSPSANAFTLSATQFASGGRTINYSASEQLVLDGNASDDVLTLTQTVPTPLVFNSGAGLDTLAVTGGTLNFSSSVAGGSPDLHLAVSNNASVTFNTTQRLGKLTLGGAATAVVNGGALVLPALEITGTAALNLGENDMIFSGTPANRSAAAAALFTYIANGVSPGAATLPRVFSSAATATRGLGLALNDLGAGRTLMNALSGQSVALNDVLVKFTYLGDSNLNGRVEIGDYLLVDRGFARGGAGWINGDYNYSGGAPDGTDYFLIDQAFLAQGGSLNTGAPAVAGDEASGVVLPSPTGAWTTPREQASLTPEEAERPSNDDVLSVTDESVL